MITTYILTFCVFAFTAIALAWDVKTRRIPNWLNVTALVLAVVFHVATNGWDGFLHSLGGFAVGFGVLLVLWLIGGGGGGDVKLMGALGAWLGPLSTVFVFLLSTFMAVFCLIAVVVYQNVAAAGATKATAGAGGSAAAKASVGAEAATGLASRTLPYAVPASMATWAVLAMRLLTGGSLM